MGVDMIEVRTALEASWDAATAYRNVSRPGVPSLGQCYPTARVLQLLDPALEIVEGSVWTGTLEEKHFWNLARCQSGEVHVDLTWQQFPPGSVVKSWWVRDRTELNDGPQTIQRVETLLARVRNHLSLPSTAHRER
jgi:hypothetical protein